MSFTKQHFKPVPIAALMLWSMIGMQSTLAAGTDAGVSISNTATVSYSVNSVPQSDVPSNISTFVVDRKIDVNVTQTGITTQPNTLNVATTFLVTNEGNSSDTFTLQYAQVSGVDVSVGLELYFDTDSSGTFNVGDTLVANNTNVAFTEDQTRRYFVVADIPPTATNGQTALVSLTATTTAVATAPGPDGAMTQEVVFAEGAGPTYDGALSATATYTIASATLAVVKSAQVVSDPTGSVAPNAKAIPGATVQYTITVTNNGSVIAGAVTLGDPIPANTTYVANSMTLNAGALVDNGGVGTTTGTPVTSISVVAGNVAASGGTATVTFRVTIN